MSDYNDQADQVQGAGGEDSPQPAGDNPVLERAHAIAREAGGLLPTDPEYQLIDQKTGDAFDFLHSVKQAAEAKKQRTAKPTPAAEYRKAMDAALARGAGRDEKLNLRAKFRRLGVDVDKK